MDLFLLNQKHTLTILKTHKTYNFTTYLLNPASKSSFRCLQTIETSQNPYKEPFSSATTLPHSLLVEKIIFNLKHGNVNSLLSYQLRLNPSVIVDVLCRCNGNLQLGQKFIDSLVLNGSNFKHSSISLSAMVHVFVRSRRLSDAQALILRMIRRSGVSRVEVVEALVSSMCGNCGTNNLVFDLLIRTYVQARKLREGTEAFRILRSKGYLVSINACNSLLGGLVKIDWVELAWEVHREVVRSGIELNAYTLNIMVNALCKDGKFDDVKSFLSEMEGSGVYADIVTYNTLIGAYCREGLLEEAFEIMSSMADKDNVIYTVLMHGYCRNGNMLEALKTRDEMLEQVMNGFCRHGRMQEAELVLRKMIEKGINPDRFKERIALSIKCEQCLLLQDIALANYAAFFDVVLYSFAVEFEPTQQALWVVADVHDG
ncbi:hypothetical protein D5086_002490, partial [Populus alba]